MPFMYQGNELERRRVSSIRRRVFLFILHFIINYIIIIIIIIVLLLLLNLLYKKL
jgi:hypothetical protein